MDYSPEQCSENAISNEWNELIEHPENMDSYIMNALMITPMDTRKKTKDGKPQKCVQVHSLSKSIINNANPDKKGLTYLSMRAIHYWKTIYERAIADPEDIKHNRNRFVSKHMHQSIVDNLYVEMEELQDQIGGDVMYLKEHKNLMDEKDKKLHKLHKQNLDLMKDITDKKTSIELFHREKFAVEEERYEKRIDYLESQLKIMSSLLANKK